MPLPRANVPVAALAFSFLTALAPLAAADDTPSYGLVERYEEPVERILGAALTSDHGYDRLAWLCDTIGHRLAGSPELEQAVAWATTEMAADGFKNVRAEEAMVPHWVRGEEAAWLELPTRQKLTILGLGNSVGTPPGGITAEVVVVGSFAELDSLGESVRGKIVLYDVPFQGYGRTVRYRGRGPSEAAKYGAVAAFVRSVGPVSLDTPHTGMLRYEDDAPQIPAAAVTIENATMMRRMAERGQTIRAHLEMGAHFLPDAPSANVIGEVVGSRSPKEVLVVGGHLDSWDVGQGAQDDGVGCIIAWEAARLIKELGLKPRRTIRVVLFTNEENGLRGGTAYRDAHQAEIGDHVGLIEADIGNGPADGFSYEIPTLYHENASPADSADAKALADAAGKRAAEMLAEIGRLLEPLDATKMEVGGSGADVGPMVREGTAGLGLSNDTAHYFDIHHTWADTFDKIDRHDLRRNIAIMAVMTYVLADMPDRLVPEGMLRGVFSSE